jgi:hypothetical protein
MQKSRSMIDDDDDNRCAVNTPEQLRSGRRFRMMTWTRRDGEAKGRGRKELRGRDLELLALISFVVDMSRVLLPVVTRQRRHSTRRALVASSLLYPDPLHFARVHRIARQGIRSPSRYVSPYHRNHVSA